MRRNLLIIMFAILLLGGCKKDKEVQVVNIVEKNPTVTASVTSVTIREKYGYPSDLKSVTVAYTKNSDYSSASMIPAEIQVDHNNSYYHYYYVKLTNLEPNTKYYYYCIFDTGYGSSEGKQRSFTTQDGGTIAGHAYVDLGLPSGLLWATCNVGTDSPEDYGDYFAWGETETKSTYNWSTYKWCNDGDYYKLTKYCTDSGYGTVDNKTVLDPEDDAARANWGGGWRMPTREEMKELLDNCTWTWTTQGGNNGYRVTGSNGNSIFLPAAGYYDDGSLDDAGSRSFYWSSSLLTDRPSSASDLYFYSGDLYMRSSHRYYGQSVRPVCPSRK